MATTNTKQSYTIPCSRAFRDRVNALAKRRSVNVADLARSVILMVAPEHLAAFPDPGEPSKGDRDTVIVKSGPAKGRPWHRKPRLQARLVPGYDMPMLRRALGLALAMDQNEIVLSLDGLEAFETAPSWTPDQEDRRNTPQGLDDEEMTRLRAIVSVLSFEPLPDGVKTPADALHVLGLPPGSKTGVGLLKARFRMLAVIHHPDSGYGNHERMSQLNSAMDILGRK